MSSKRKQSAAEILAHLQDKYRRLQMDGETDLAELCDEIEQARVDAELERSLFFGGTHETN